MCVCGQQQQEMQQVPAGGVSTRVSPVEFMGAAVAPTGHITVAAVSCPLAPCRWVTPEAAQGGPACEGWHSLPQDPGTFARWVSNAVLLGFCRQASYRSRVLYTGEHWLLCAVPPEWPFVLRSPGGKV